MFGRSLGLSLEKHVEISEWPVRGAAAGAAVRGRRALGLFKLALVLVIVAVDAQQFPIASIRRVIAVVVITVMDGKLVHRRAVELTSAPPTNPRVNFECAFPVAVITTLRRASRVEHEAIQAGMINRLKAFIHDGQTCWAAGTLPAIDAGSVVAAFVRVREQRLPAKSRHTLYVQSRCATPSGVETVSS